MIEHGCLENLKQEFSDYLVKQNYSKNSLIGFRTTLNNLERYMMENGYNTYTAEVGSAFLEHNRPQQNCLAYMEHMSRAIRRLNEFIGGGNFFYREIKPDCICPPQFSEVFDGYLNRLRLLGYRKGTIQPNKRYCLNMLTKFAEEGIVKLSDIKPVNIYEFIEQSSKSADLPTHLRRFFNYLFKEGITDFNLSLIVPSIRVPRPVPSVYTTEEMAKFVSAFDRKTSMGKRDYAIVLLALRLGVRSCDIVNLKISDVNFQTKKISLVQVKTLVPQSLELLPEIEEALTSYLHCRPSIDIPNIFLSVRAPIRQLCASFVHYITSTHLKKAGIETGGRKRGGHSLRMTFASELVAEQVPYDAVRKILGHEDPAAVRYYVKLDTESLRRCAIETPQLSGKLGKLVAGITGGA